MTNKEAFEIAKMHIPGGVNSPVRAYKSVGANPPFISHANGAYIFDIEGKKYLDLVLSYGPNIFAHANEKITQAIIDAAQKGSSFGAPTVQESSLAIKVKELYKDIEQIRFVNSGTEATMSAIRLARAYSKKDGILKFDGCYHGHADSLLVNAGSGMATYQTPSSLGVTKGATKDTFTAVYNDIASVKEQIVLAKNQGSEIGTIIIEPLAGNMNFVPAKKEFLQDLRRLCDEEKIVLIFDEVMSGFRARLGGAKEFYGISGDIVCFGKVIGGGLPVGAYAGSKEIMSLLSPVGGVYQAGTLSGNPLAMAAGYAALEMLEYKMYEEFDRVSGILCEQMCQIAKESGVAFSARSVGSMLGFFFLENLPNNYDEVKLADTAKFAKFHAKMLECGVNLAPSAFETSFICTEFKEQQISEFLDAFKQAIKV